MSFLEQQRPDYVAHQPVTQVGASVRIHLGGTVATIPLELYRDSHSSSLEMFALLQSDPEAVPTFNCIAVVQDVPAGDHELTVNGAGVTPHSGPETVVGDDAVTPADVRGEIPAVAREHPVKMELDPSEADSDLSDLAIEDDFAGASTTHRCPVRMPSTSTAAGRTRRKSETAMTRSVRSASTLATNRALM